MASTTATAETEDLIFLTPLFREKIWGGRRLEREFGHGLPDGPIGEAWVISAHPALDCPIASGPGAGMTLFELWKARPELFGNHPSEIFPLLVKIIDAEEDVSIQVHPDDAYARSHHLEDGGKYECWYILDADPGATIIVGQRAGSPEELHRLVEEGRWDEVVNEIPIAAGDFLAIAPGTVHAVKRGTLLLEIQQPSDITYRLYDYDRPDAEGKLRELHVERALEVVDFSLEPPERAFKAEDAMARKVRVPATSPLLWGKPLAGSLRLEENPYFSVDLVQSMGVFTLPLEGPFQCVSVIEGEGSLNGHAVAKGDHLIVACGVRELKLEGTLRLVLARPAGISG